jgi:hypothetical protein
MSEVSVFADRRFPILLWRLVALVSDQEKFAPRHFRR